MLHHCRQNFAIDVKAVSISLMVTHPQVPALAEIQRSQRGHAGPGDVLMHLQVARARNVQAPQLAENMLIFCSQLAQPARTHRQQPQPRQLRTPPAPIHGHLSMVMLVGSAGKCILP